MRIINQVSTKQDESHWSRFHFKFMFMFLEFKYTSIDWMTKNRWMNFIFKKKKKHPLIRKDQWLIFDQITTRSIESLLKQLFHISSQLLQTLITTNKIYFHIVEISGKMR